MKSLLIACKVLKDQVDKLGTLTCDVIYLDQGLHRTPQVLNTELQQAIDKAIEYDELILGYGLCSRSVIGLKVKPHQRLIIPRVDDCIALSMGQRNKYSEEFIKNPGTYFFTKGWVDVGDNPLNEYHKTFEKYGKDVAEWTIREGLKHYQRTLFIKTSQDDEDEAKDYAKQFAHFFNLTYEEMQGSQGYIKRLVFGPRDDHDFVVLGNGQSPQDEMFL